MNVFSYTQSRAQAAKLAWLLILVEEREYLESVRHFQEKLAAVFNVPLHMIATRTDREILERRLQ